MEKKRKNKLHLIQLLLLLIGLSSAAILFYDMAILPRQNQELAEELKEEFPGDTPPGNSSPTAACPKTLFLGINLAPFLHL